MIVQGKGIKDIRASEVGVGAVLGGALGYVGAKVSGPIARALTKLFRKPKGKAYAGNLVYLKFPNVTKAESILTRIATESAENVGDDVGNATVRRTKIHAEFAKRVAGELGTAVETEVSYLNREVVKYGTKGSVRLDVVLRDADGKPIAIFDLKQENQD